MSPSLLPPPRAGDSNESGTRNCHAGKQVGPTSTLCGTGAPTRDNVDDVVGNPEGLVEFLSCGHHLFKYLPGFVVMGGGVDELLNLWEKEFHSDKRHSPPSHWNPTVTLDTAPNSNWNPTVTPSTP